MFSYLGRFDLVTPKVMDKSLVNLATQGLLAGLFLSCFLGKAVENVAELQIQRDL